MERISQLLLTFLLNACWQAALIAAVAAVCAWLLRDWPARHKHYIWVAALVFGFCLPALTGLRPVSGALFRSQPSPPAADQLPVAGLTQPLSDAPVPLPRPASSIPISGQFAAGLLVLYGLFLGYRVVRLIAAWRQTRALTRDASPAELLGQAWAVIETCKASLGVTRVGIHCSATLRVPITVNSRRPLIILPEPLLQGAPADVLTAAFGHELVHVQRRDYALNLLYELIYLPLSFHPALALVRRRIRQTRELRCDEVVAERLLDAHAYARSLVQLASSALPPCKPAETLTVGITDADILEVRIMSLLRKSRSSVRRSPWLLAAACVLLALPCAAAAAFAFHFDITPQPVGLIAQVPWVEAQGNQEQSAVEAKRRERRETQEREEGALKEREFAERAAHDPQFRAEMEQREKHEREEREARAKRQAALARLARVTMDQAIQAATNQEPGKVLECSLVGEHWEAPGKLANNGVIFYHVVILTGDEASPTATHVWVNAIDGSVMKVEKEDR